jgi:hypothetical protein
MNKQELINDIVRNLDAAYNQPKSEYRDGYCDALQMVRDLAQQLDEPEPQLPRYKLVSSELTEPLVDDSLAHKDYEEVLADHNRLVRELDAALNGDGAAKQASLCDIVSQVKNMAKPLVDDAMVERVAVDEKTAGIHKAAFESLKILMDAPNYLTLGQWKEMMRLAATEPEMNWSAEMDKLANEGSAMWLPADLYDTLAKQGILHMVGRNLRRSAPKEAAIAVMKEGVVGEKRHHFTEPEVKYLLESVEMDIGSGKIPKEQQAAAQSVFEKLSKR